MIMTQTQRRRSDIEEEKAALRYKRERPLEWMKTLHEEGLLEEEEDAPVQDVER